MSTPMIPATRCQHLHHDRLGDGDWPVLSDQLVSLTSTARPVARSTSTRAEVSARITYQS